VRSGGSHDSSQQWLFTRFLYSVLIYSITQQRYKRDYLRDNSTALGAAMRVCILDPSGSGFGYVHQLCQALVEQGCDVHLYTSPHWERAASGIEQRYQVHSWFYRYTQEGSAMPGLRGKMWRLARLFKHIIGMTKLVIAARRYDVIHVQWLPVPALDIATIWLMSTFRPVVYTVHDLYPYDSHKTIFLKALLKRIYRIPQALIVHSQSTTNGLLHDFRNKLAPIYQINRGNFDHLLFLDHKLSNHSGVKNAIPPVLFFGNIRENKGLDILLIAMAKVVKTIPLAKLLIVGIPRVDMTPYKELVRRLALSSSAEFRLGYVEEAGLPAIFQEASVVVLPYRVIDQSGVAITACTIGKAIVATAIGGMKEMVQEGGNGILVPPDDEDALADAIVRILESTTLRKKFEENPRRYSETELGWDSIARQTIGVYRLVQPKRSCRSRGNCKGGFNE